MIVTNILKCDLYRFSKSKLLYGLMVFTVFIAFMLMMAIRQDIRIGISVFGDLTAFRGIDDIVRVGVQPHKGLGIIIAILLSVFIGQEYQWKTWQYKWITSKSRASIYLSKAIFSSAVSALLFLVYEMTALFSSSQIRVVITNEYTSTIVCGLFIYAALGAIICLLSMLIKNNIASTVVSLCYILFSETLVSVMSNVGSFSTIVGRFVELGVKHSIYGMSTLVSSTVFSPETTIAVVINSLAIILLSTMVGLMVFQKYEL